MNIVAKLYSGSRLYGTNHSQSDIDIRGIYQPDIKNVLLNEFLETISVNPPNKKMQDHDIDMVFYSLSRYFDLLNKNAIQAIELLFAPDSCMLYQSSVWQLIKSFRLDILQELDLKQSGLYFSMILDEYINGILHLTPNGFKNLAHATRIVDQCFELYKTQNLIFPRPQVDLYLKIRHNALDDHELTTILYGKLQQFNEIKAGTASIAAKQQLLLRCYGL